MKYCNQCGSESLLAEERLFKNGSTHIQLTCRDCGTFNGFQKQAGRKDILIAKDHPVQSNNDVENLVDKTRDQIQSFFKENTDKKITLVAKVK